MIGAVIEWAATEATDQPSRGMPMTVLLRVPAAPPAPALLLRSWCDADAEALIEAYRDPVLRQWTRMPVAGPEDAAHWLDVRHQGWESGTYFSFAVLADRPAPDGGPAADGGGELLGNVALKRPEPRGDSAEVGYWTAAAARGRGVAPRALEALTRWSFETFGLVRLELLHQVDNLASCRVAEKAGYGFERTMPARPPFPHDGHLHVRLSAERHP